MRAGDGAGKIGDGGDHRWPGLGRRMLVRPVVAAWMEAQRFGSGKHGDGAIAQVGLDERPADRLRHGEQPLRRFRRSGGNGCANGL
jgi:hypothetical protein